MSDIIKEWGIKLIVTKIRLCGSPVEFFRQSQINKWNLQESVSHCLKVYKDVLWMRLTESSEGVRMPNGCRWFKYITFYSNRHEQYYRFRSWIVRHEVEDVDEYIKKRPWEIKTFKKENVYDRNRLRLETSRKEKAKS